MAVALIAPVAGGADPSEPLPPSPGQIVGRIELAAPSASPFIVRATLPVPPSTFPRADNRMPFVIRDANGQDSPAQVEIVSCYAGDLEDADVVEVLARVRTPAGAIPGDRIGYDVVYLPHVPTAFVADPDVEALLSDVRGLTIRTSDVFGNAYIAEPLRSILNASRRRVQILRDGALARQASTHDPLLPAPAVSGPNGTLPHMMGVHAYLTRWSTEPFFSLDLRIHNASSGLLDSTSVDDPLGKVYFRSLEIRLPQGWTLLPAFDEPTFGQPYDDGQYRVWPIVTPLPGGKLHMMPALSQFHRRFAVAKVGSEARALSVLREETLAFCRPGNAPSGAELFSWWNTATAGYFPQKHRLPRLDHVGLAQIRIDQRHELLDRIAQLAGQAPITWPLFTDRLGWAFPWGTSDGGMVGGSEIFLYDGVDTACAASLWGYRLSQLVHQMSTDRQPNVLFDKNGLPTMMESWTVQAANRTYLPVWWFNAPMLWAADPFGVSKSPSFQRNAVAAQGLKPDYEDALLGFHPVDEAHLVRYTRSPKVLVWLGNDALARDDIRAQAEGIRFTYSIHPQDNYGAVIPTGMLKARQHVDSHPGEGLSYGRAEAWGLDVMVAAYAILEPEWRSRTRGWFELVTDLLEDGQADCTGILMSTPLLNVFNGQYRCRQSIECAITENALVSMRERVFGRIAPARVQQINGVLTRSLYAMISPLVWSDQLNGPWAMIATGLYDVDFPPYCTYWPADGNYGSTDAYQTWSSFAYGYEVTGDAVFLDKAREMLSADLYNGLHADGVDNIANRAALLALVQSLHP